MMIEDLKIWGAKLISAPVFIDSRGSFEIFWEPSRLKGIDLIFQPSNCYHSYNLQKGTVRAFHFQRPPYGQTKLISCVGGRVWDVILDLRSESPTFRRWQGIQMTAISGKSILVPSGCAHGFCTLEDNTTIAYLIEGDYRPEFAAVVLWNDPGLGIDWPVSNPIISEKDLQAPSLDSYFLNLNSE